MLHLSDGEVATAKAVFVDAEYEDIMTTNRPLTYKGPPNAAYTIPVAEIRGIAVSSELG